MSFSPEWLALRAPYDAKARDAELARRFAASLPPAPLIVDLGCGTGANALALAPLLPQARFRLVDSDRALLDIARRRLPCEIVQADLNHDLARLLGDADALSASALMDLVSAAWFDALAAQAATRRLPLLFTLNVDGRHSLRPADDNDSLVFAAFVRDQRRDKGFGPALGPEAPRYMQARLASLGASVILADSSWRVAGDGRDLLAAFLDGMAEAATRAAPADATAIAGWRRRRESQIANGSLSLTVGHQDLLALW
jgi:SAM-dependent methyltransferase